MAKSNKKNESDFSDFPPIGGLMVSNMVAIDKMKPLFLYREKRVNDEDSGWRIFSGYEDETYNDDPDNAGVYDPQTILEIDPSLAEVLLKGVGSVFERASAEDEWYTVDDYPLEDDYMKIIPLTDVWNLELNHLFERHLEESGDLYFTTGDKSLRLTIWGSDKPKPELLEEYTELVKNRDQSDSPTQEVFDFSDDDVFRIGYSIREADGSKSYEVIFGFCIIDEEVVQAALYFDEPKDKTWALDTWKSITLKQTTGN